MKDLGNQPGYEPPTQEERDEFLRQAKLSREGGIVSQASRPYDDSEFSWYRFANVLAYGYEMRADAFAAGIDIANAKEYSAQILESLAYDNTDGPKIKDGK